MKSKKFILFTLTVLSLLTLTAKTQVKVISNQDAPGIFIECDYCYTEYLRQNLSFLNFVRDRKDADIFVQFYENSNSGGGINYTLDFTGANKYSGMNDTLKFKTDPTMSQDYIRDKILAYMKIGLVRYLANTPLADKIRIDFETEKDSSESKEDSWDNWVFEISANAYFNGQSSYNSFNGWGNMSASRTTESFKTEISLNNNYSQDLIEYDNSKISNISRSLSVNAEGVFSIDNHWSAGLWARYNSSSYSNIDLNLSLAPGFEYNIFPYSDYTRRQLRVDYRIGSSFTKYIDTTIYDKIKENLFTQTLSVSFSYILPWGSFSLSMTGNTYIHDLKKNGLSLYAYSSLKIFKGLSFNYSLSYSYIHNLLNLPKEGVTRDEVLLRIRQLETAYSFYGSFGLSYTFGSIYNNAVNPRFGG